MAPFPNDAFPMALCEEIIGYSYKLKLASLPIPCKVSTSGEGY